MHSATVVNACACTGLAAVGARRGVPALSTSCRMGRATTNSSWKSRQAPFRTAMTRIDGEAAAHLQQAQHDSSSSSAVVLAAKARGLAPTVSNVVR